MDKKYGEQPRRMLEEGYNDYNTELALFYALVQFEGDALAMHNRDVIDEIWDSSSVVLYNGIKQR
ncbi:hypothetical protein KXD40_008707 [Peronospora effusa]|uniref:Uncharacterized protein n=1 Tax=Peronospora effusa TaxID=542832 RepID=A0A3M6VN48_9STRA|nr:hypothetical protein DD238_005272 [Peronospora effusa]RQM09129.1 hypothetical protein DD237_005392 [Peronospora effusa]UIZ22065.1 hypothetical protein KXD40_008707 [Peronospora effusa]